MLDAAVIVRYSLTKSCMFSELLSVSEWSEKTASAGEKVLNGETSGFARFVPFLGPAIIASIAYMDPGNFATNIQSGAQFGYELLWVVVAANLIAMLFQSLSAKLGIITGKSLATLCREQFPRPVVYCMWIGSEIAAMATDLAEFLGGAIGLSLLFHLPLMASLVVMGVTTYGILLLQNYGFRPMEIVIGAFVSLISLSYLVEFLITKPNLLDFAYHSVVPHISNANALTLAVGIVGATVMPHAIYLHSSLTQNRMPVRNDADRLLVLRYSNWEVLVALGVAGLVNMAMVAMAAAVFYATGHSDVATIETAYMTLVPLMGIAAAGVFLLSLLASGFSSSVVGTMAGQTIMQDFVHFQIPLWLRRAVTMIPAFVVVWLGADPTQSLILSQVVLSLTLPIPVIALIILTSRRDIMGDFVNGPIVKTLALLGGALVLFLNIILLTQFFGVPMPFFS